MIDRQPRLAAFSLRLNFFHGSREIALAFHQYGGLHEGVDQHTQSSLPQRTFAERAHPLALAGGYPKA